MPEWLDRRSDAELLGALPRAVKSRPAGNWPKGIQGWSTSRRSSDEAAKDITQTTFAILARKATSLMSHNALGTWLHRNTVFETRKYLHAECRHLRKMKTLTDHQQEISSEQPWSRVGPFLDEAIHGSFAKDREIFF